MMNKAIAAEEPISNRNEMREFVLASILMALLIISMI